MHTGEILVYGLLAAAANVVGGLWLTARKQHSQKLLQLLVAIGAGFMLATVFVEIIPESVELWNGSAGTPMLLVLAGYLFVQFTEHTVAPHFHFGEETHHDEMLHSGVA